MTSEDVDDVEDEESSTCCLCWLKQRPLSQLPRFNQPCTARRQPGRHPPRPRRDTDTRPSHQFIPSTVPDRGDGASLGVDHTLFTHRSTRPSIKLRNQRSLSWEIFLTHPHTLQPNDTHHARMASRTPQHVVITGGSSGLGREIALKYARGGARLLLVARRRSELEIVAQECRTLGAKTSAIHIADISIEKECESIALAAKEALQGKIDILVLNAGQWIA